MNSITTMTKPAFNLCEEKKMNQMTNGQLLQALLGDVAESLSEHSLSELFGLTKVRQTANRVAEDVLTYSAPNKLLAARELLKRALEEDMSDTGVSLSKPKAAVDYLKLLLAGQPEERFVALWLDSQHRLIHNTA